MYKATDFVRRALTHAKRESIPENAVLALPRQSCGAEPWQYLFGSVRVRTAQATLDRYFEDHYKKQMTRARFDELTAGWDRNGYATDCQGLLDAYLTYDRSEPTDINADMNYRLWCTDKGRIGEIGRPYVLGEALFRANKAGRMTHVGWICGFMPDGEPLIIEARGIAYGVVVTELSERDFTHRGLMTKKFCYDENGEENDMEQTVYEAKTPMAQGEEYRAMQAALNLGGYTDGECRPLEEDGKWGARSQQAFEKLLLRHAKPEEETAPTDGETGENAEGAENGGAVTLRVHGVEISVIKL